MSRQLESSTLLYSFIVAICLLIPYEYYWRIVKHWPASYDVEDLDHWAEIRRGVDKLDEKDVVILGSSRGHFDINIHQWDSITGRRPVQLAYPGSSPFHPVADIVNNSNFNGLLVISIAPGLFFTVADSWGARRGKAFVDRYHKATYAQRFNHLVYKHIDPIFGYSDPSINLESLVDRLPFPNRDSVNTSDIWPPMVASDKYRNVWMTDCFEQDTVLQRRQKDIWFPPGDEERKNRFADSIDVIMDHYVGLVKKFQERGGKVAFLRPPISGKYLESEPITHPREKYWDRLLQESGCPGLHFMDHPSLADMDPPEWSHLSKAQAKVFRETVVEFLTNEGLL